MSIVRSIEVIAQSPNGFDAWILEMHWAARRRILETSQAEKRRILEFGRRRIREGLRAESLAGAGTKGFGHARAPLHVHGLWELGRVSH